MSAAGRAVPSSRPLAGVLVGYGLIAEGHLAGYARVDGLTVGTVVEPNAQRRALAARAIPDSVVAASIDEVDLAAHDFVDICSPPSTHLAHAVAALAADVPVMCEKPLVMDTSELRSLDQAEAASDGFVYPCHNYVFAPSMQRLLSILPQLRPSGAPLRGHFRTLRVGHARGVPEWNPDWRRDVGLAGGGILQDHGPHSIYLAMRAVGREVTAVRARLMRPVTGPFDVTEDLVLLELHFGGGSTVTIELDWGSDLRQTAYLIDGAWGYVRVLDDRITAHGPDVALRQQIESDFNDPRHGSWFASVLRDFRLAFDDPSRAAALRREASEVVQVIAAAYRSDAMGGDMVHRSNWALEAEDLLGG
jgi:predicted dehydrogenase